jgi:hypothetical protein
MQRAELPTSAFPVRGKIDKEFGRRSPMAKKKPAKKAAKKGK